MTDRVMGVDGAPDGWVAVIICAHDHKLVSAASRPEFAAIVADHVDATIVAVDMPIGIGPEWPRPPDQEARRLLAAGRSSVFFMPPIGVLEAATYVEAVERCQQLGIPGVSQQAYALRSKIFEVAAVAATDPRVREVHPEVSFASMNHGPLAHRKKTWAGFQERRRLLRVNGIELDDTLDTTGRAGVDDVLDAAAAAWTAARIARGEAQWIPANAGEADARIWY